MRPDNICLVVTDFGGAPSIECPLGRPAPLGEWAKLRLDVDCGLGAIELLVDNEFVSVLPIELSLTAGDPAFRFSYQGSGVGNTGTTLLDDVTVDRVGSSGISPSTSPSRASASTAKAVCPMVWPP